MGACARNMYSDHAEIKPAQCCIKLVFHLTYTMMHGSTKLKIKTDFVSEIDVSFFISYEAVFKVKPKANSNIGLLVNKANLVHNFS